jgi:dephospho-CoA kinase
MFAGKPIIGLAGGIGSGKSFVASLFAGEGCLVLDADASARAAYADPAVRAALRQWWGDAAFLPDGSPDRRAIAERVFSDPPERAKLEHLIHPRVAADRDRLMRLHADDPLVRAYVWDVPLLFETGLNKSCDAVVFVDAPLAERARRVARSRHWPPGELERRENSQYPLDKKRAMSHYVLGNTADAATAREQVRDVLSRILAQSNPDPRPGADGTGRD